MVHVSRELPEKERKSERWIKKASTLSERELRAEVDAEIEKKTGMPRERFKTFYIALPESVYESLCQAEKKLAWTLGIDIETTPTSRILVWEALSQWILQTDEGTIKLQTEGVA